MTYTALTPPLHDTADAARDFFRTRFGLSRLRVEEAPYPNASYTPTFSGETRDHHILCIEVSDSPYTNALDAFVLDCKEQARPVKLFVAIPSGEGDKSFKVDLRRAKNRGVGVVEAGPGSSGHVIHEAVSLLLTGVRPYQPADFPAKYREAISAAYSTFLSGDPPKGCARLYDEIESLCRRIGKKALKKRVFRDMPAASAYNFDTGNWGPLVEFMERQLDRTACGCPELTKALWHRIDGITTYRNETGHKPATTAALTTRDRALRTRFEGALDILRELISASRPLNP